MTDIYPGPVFEMATTRFGAAKCSSLRSIGVTPQSRFSNRLSQHVRCCRAGSLQGGRSADAKGLFHAVR